MPWPLSQDYNEAIQNPTSTLGDPELQRGQPVAGALGMPMPRSGNFADVYEFVGASGTRWAIKCFTRAVPGLRERYTEISKHLIQAKLPFTVDFEFLQRGIRIRGDWYPVLKMQWVEGLLLNEFVRNNLDKPALLEGIGQIWVRMARSLRDANMAHADLQHGNVLLVARAHKAGSLSVKLIDYDGMWVPALANKKSGEVGHPAYQHPQRLHLGTYSAEVDRLPLLAVACALRCLVVGGKPLWERYDNGDNLLFREADLQAPDKSALFKELHELPDPQARILVKVLQEALARKLESVPAIQDLLHDTKPASERAPATPPPPKPAMPVAPPVARPASPPMAIAAVVAPTIPTSPQIIDQDSPAPPTVAKTWRSSIPLWAQIGGGVIAAALLLAFFSSILLWALWTTGPKDPPFAIKVVTVPAQVAQGGKLTLKVRAERKDYQGPIEVELIDLPRDVKVAKATLVRDDVELKLTADDNAAEGIKKIRVRGTAVADKNQTADSSPFTLLVTVKARPVADPLFALKVEHEDFNLRQGSTIKLKVRVDRKGFEEPIDLQLSEELKGVTVAKTTLDRGDDVVDMTVTAEMNAAEGKKEIIVRGTAGKNQTADSDPFSLTVTSSAQKARFTLTVKHPYGIHGILPQGCTIKLKIGSTRNVFKEQIELKLSKGPPGVTADDTTLYPGNNEVDMIVTATLNAVKGKTDIVVLGTAVDAKKQPILKVEQPFSLLVTESIELGNEKGQASHPGVFTPVDPPYKGAKKHQRFLFRMEKGKTYQIEMNSDSFLPYLYVEDTNGALPVDRALIGADDKLRARMRFTATVTRNYCIIATYFAGELDFAGELGPFTRFTLNIRETDAPPTLAGPLPDEWVPKLIVALGEPDEGRRRAAAFALGRIGAKAAAAVPELLRLVAGGKQPLDVRIAAAEALDRMGYNSVIEERIDDLLKVLANANEEAELRVRLTWVLNNFRTHIPTMKKAGQILTEICQGRADPNDFGTRQNCASLLGSVEKEKAPEAALIVLGESLGQKAGTLIDKNGMRYGDNRISAVEALGLIGRERVREHKGILKQLRVLAVDKDIDKELREAAEKLVKALDGAPPSKDKEPKKEDTLIREMKFVRVPKGMFWMGWDSKERQNKQVTIDADFELAAYTVTQEQWQAVMADNPSLFSRKGEYKDKVATIADADLKRFPVEGVSWHDVQKFLKKLNAREKGRGWTYRLPSAAEWEYGCRAGATSKEECSFDFYLAKPTNDLSSNQANFFDLAPAGMGAKRQYLGRPEKVGSYAPNKLGLYDMHGNVWQWCDDLWAPAGSARVVRGGCWNSNNAWSCRSATRFRFEPDDRGIIMGFRLARSSVE